MAEMNNRKASAVSDDMLDKVAGGAIRPKYVSSFFCEKCGKMIHHGRFCDKCDAELKKDVMKAQKKAVERAVQAVKEKRPMGTGFRSKDMGFEKK